MARDLPLVHRALRRAPRALVAAIALVSNASCDPSGAPDTSGAPAGPALPESPACPARFSADPAREAAILARLRTAAEGAAALDRRSEPVRLCFGRVESSVVTEKGTLLMDTRLAEARAAARVAHLVTHLADGLPALVAGEGECDARVEQALAAEARALGLELRLLRALGAPPPEGEPWEVEAVHWASPPEAREAALVDYLRAHPDGAPGVDALAAGYARRCAKRGR